MTYLFRLIACLTVLLSSIASATVIYNDRLTVDLSDLRPSPTFISDIGIGSFDIVGSLTSSDSDFFQVNLVGSVIESIQVTQWTAANPIDWKFWVNENSYVYLNESIINENLMDSLNINITGNQVTMGTQTGSLLVDYLFRVLTTAVPIPAAAWLLGSALVGVGFIRSRKKSPTSLPTWR